MKGGVRGPPRRRRRGCCRRAARRRRAADKPGQRRHGDADGDKDHAVRREAPPVRWPQPALQQTQSSQVAGADTSTEEAGAHDDPVSTGVTWRRGSNIDSTRNAPSSPTPCTRGNPHDESRLKWLGSSRNAPRRCCRCVRRRRCHRPWLRFMVLSKRSRRLLGQHDETRGHGLLCDTDVDEAGSAQQLGELALGDRGAADERFVKLHTGEHAVGGLLAVSLG